MPTLDTPPPYAVGDRIELVRTEDEHTHLKPGAVGEIRHIDSMGTVHVTWDEDGSHLGLIPGADDFRVLNDHR